MDERSHLQHRYLELTKTRLPERGRCQEWSLQRDHCFMRVILDHLFEDCWYRHLDQRQAACKQLSPEQLRRAIVMAEQMYEEGQPLVTKMNAQSLKWRMNC